MRNAPGSSIINHQSPIFNPKGFTTIELIMVIIIISVIAVTAVPKFTSMSFVSVGGAAEMIRADIRYAQELAMAEHIAKSVTFASGAGSYTTVDSETQELPSGVTISNDFTVTFNSLGEPVLGGGGSVIISAGVETGTIGVTQYTGKVSINCAAGQGRIF